MSNNKRGRKSGVSDSVNIKLSCLVKYLPEGAFIPVRRKWIEQTEEFFNIKFDMDRPNPTVEDNTKGDPTVEETGSDSDVAVRSRLEFSEEEL